MMLEEKQEQYAHTRRTWAEIDLDAVQHNFQEIKGWLRPGVKVCCVIKADGYGHGAVTLAREYEKLGAELVRRFQSGGGFGASPGGHPSSGSDLGLYTACLCRRAGKE